MCDAAVATSNIDEANLACVIAATSDMNKTNLACVVNAAVATSNIDEANLACVIAATSDMNKSNVAFVVLQRRHQVWAWSSGVPHGSLLGQVWLLSAAGSPGREWFGQAIGRLRHQASLPPSARYGLGRTVWGKAMTVIWQCCDQVDDAALLAASNVIKHHYSHVQGTALSQCWYIWAATMTVFWQCCDQIDDDALLAATHVGLHSPMSGIVSQLAW